MANSHQVDDLINPDLGKPEEPTDDDTRFIDEYTEAVAHVEEHLFFVNVIRSQGRCGFANGCTSQYLLNTDGSRRYRVTIETRWRSGSDSGTSQRVVINEAGGRVSLGCTCTSHIPVTYYTREVVGEAPF